MVQPKSRRAIRSHVRPVLRLPCVPQRQPMHHLPLGRGRVCCVPFPPRPAERVPPPPPALPPGFVASHVQVTLEDLQTFKQAFQAELPADDGTDSSIRRVRIRPDLASIARQTSHFMKRNATTTPLECLAQLLRLSEARNIAEAVAGLMFPRSSPGLHSPRLCPGPQ